VEPSAESGLFFWNEMGSVRRFTMVGFVVIRTGKIWIGLHSIEAVSVVAVSNWSEGEQLALREWALRLNRSFMIVNHAYAILVRVVACFQKFTIPNDTISVMTEAWPAGSGGQASSKVQYGL
jgi:hypothetical protein